MKKALFISVHPDDETFGCGGTILKHKQQGDEIYWLIITSMTLDHPYKFSEESISRRADEINLVADKYGFTRTIQLGFPTILLDEINFRELVAEIDKAIGAIQPQIIYIVNRSDVHSDHRVAFDAVSSCTKSFRKPFIEKILMYETLSETEFAPALSENVFIPNVFTDISEFMEQKLTVMSTYASELMPDNMPRSYSAVTALAAYRGSRINVKYAEAFMLLFEKC
jgi:LmbE family N-acetylglucosaminyl deacetylase